ncbi:hypothetical protein SISNIDRAFT_546597 [Sistotremastrum niveocremeum HHB9708]|uniref:Uncharacterized protein n=2 Tax=Sistotremastraceae TaxID=3402574 RepID=A0A165AAA9_9AGAM|nr:hypothetical protein SISNIDRAFT_546597 [Sistotremastrum niveocremeum HHB9708]KZT42475.1 hypothetical protein SISSUDRAFT_1125635 [Sistotremastrum suecicum HHB10207 ss-3]
MSVLRTRLSSKIARLEHKKLIAAHPLRRFASSGADHGHDGHDSHELSTVTYPSETFSTPFWRNIVIGGISAFLLYEYYPSILGTSDDRAPLLTRFIAYYSPDPSKWERINQRHLLHTVDQADDQLIFQEAKKPFIHRYQFTGAFDAGSPNNVPLGTSVDLSDLVVRRDYELKHQKQ